MPSKSRETIERIQHELSRQGFSPGSVDGVWGRRTEGAVRRFQLARGLLADGIVGPKTFQALFGTAPAQDAVNDAGVPWFQEARRLLGVRERVGPGSEPAIIEGAQKAGIDYKSDDIPWCGLFVAHCVSATLSDESMPNNPLGARNWQRFGAPCDAKIGAILVFWRGDRNGFKGHVGFYAGEDSTAFQVLGGNQGDRVSLTRIARDRLLAIRWPASAPISDSGALLLADGSTIFSTDEA